MRILAMALLLALMTGAASAQDNNAGLELAKNNGCLNCHALDKKALGPAFVEIAAKYRTKRNAQARLAYKIKTGSKGVWGDAEMPPSSINDETIRALAAWVLSL